MSTSGGLKYATLAIKIFSILMGCLIFLVSKYAFILFTASMLPTLISLCFDRAEHKCASATVCTFNIMGMMPHLLQLWRAPNVNAAAQHLILDSMTWLVTYSAVLLGVVLYIAIPALVSRVYLVRANIQIRDLVSQRDRIAKEWEINVPNYTHDKA